MVYDQVCLRQMLHLKFLLKKVHKLKEPWSNNGKYAEFSLNRDKRFDDYDQVRK